MGNVFSIQSFSFGMAVGIVLTGAWFLGRPSIALAPAKDQSQAAATTTDTMTRPLADTSGALSVSDQPSGEQVRIESITVPPPGVWVAVREVVGGALGNILGAARAGGPRSNFDVPLLRSTLPAHTYAAELYRDDSDGTFSPVNDSVYVDFGSGQPVVTYFTTTS